MRGFSLTVDRLAPNVLRIALRGELDLSRTLLLEKELQAVEAMKPDALVIEARRWLAQGQPVEAALDPWERQRVLGYLAAGGRYW